MVLLVLITNLWNPSLSISILMPENDTYRLSGPIYHVHVDNVFQQAIAAPGMFIEGFYTKYYPVKDEYFINSGKPFTIIASGAGIMVALFPNENITMFLGAGYFFGEFTYPVVQDSGRIYVLHDTRHSIGAHGGLSIHIQVNQTDIGIRLCSNLIPFTAQDAVSEEYPSAPPGVDRASLYSIGAGLQVGLHL